MPAALTVAAAHAFVLVFLIYSPGTGLEGEDGMVWARSCAAAEAWVRAGLKPGQAMLVLDCKAVSP